MPIRHEIIFISIISWNSWWAERGSNIWYWDNIRMKIVGAEIYKGKHK